MHLCQPSATHTNTFLHIYGNAFRNTRVNILYLLITTDSKSTDLDEKCFKYEMSDISHAFEANLNCSL